MRMILRWAPLALGLLVPWLVPPVAHAAGGGATLEQTRDAVLVLVLLAGAYLLAHLVVDRLQRRMLLVSGAEYVLVGALVAFTAGGRATNMAEFDAILPVIALAAGWFGLLRGMDLGVDEFRNAPKGAVQLAILDDALPAAVISVAAYYGIRWGLPQVPHDRAMVLAGLLGAGSISGSSRPIDVLKKRYQIEGKIVPLLRRAARLGDAGAILLLGFVIVMGRPPSEGTGQFVDLPQWTWFLVSIGVGAVLGVLFTQFMGKDETENGRFLALVGIITFASGAAYLLHVGALTVNLVLGAVLVNLAREGHHIRSTLERTERPMSLILYVCAGALWTPPADWGVTALGFAAYVVLRSAAKAVATWVGGLGGVQRKDLFRGLLGQGDVAIATAVTFRLLDRSTDGLANVVYTILVASVIFHDLVAPRALRGLLVDAGQLRREQGA
ncbi:MAG: cation:proton antiporter [Polyangiales bacterium]|nr:hypothetical protein [Myxococcales bacterium]